MKAEGILSWEKLELKSWGNIQEKGWLQQGDFQGRIFLVAGDGRKHVWRTARPWEQGKNLNSWELILTLPREWLACNYFSCFAPPVSYVSEINPVVTGMLLSSSSVCKRQDGWIRIWDDNICSNLAVNGEVASRNIEIPSVQPTVYILVNSGFHIYRQRMLQWCATTSILLQMWQPVPRKSHQVGHLE